MEGAVDGVMCMHTSALSPFLAWQLLFLGEARAKECALGSDFLLNQYSSVVDFWVR